MLLGYYFGEIIQPCYPTQNMKLLYNDISSSVIVNNHISDPFPIKRGVRQGCSLSMLLYVICVESFAHKIRTLTEIKGLKLPGSNLEVKLSMYVDDSTAILTSDFCPEIILLGQNVWKNLRCKN